MRAGTNRCNALSGATEAHAVSTAKKTSAATRNASVAAGRPSRTTQTAQNPSATAAPACQPKSAEATGYTIHGAKLRSWLMSASSEAGLHVSSDMSDYE